MTKNKRSRSNNSTSDTASGASGATRSGSATPTNANTASSNKHLGTEIAASMKGTNLEPLAEVVASLPKQISALIKENADLMFKRHREIKTREASLSLYDKEIVVNKSTGEKAPYRPKCCRIENPITYSRLLKEDDRLKETLAEYDDLIEAYNHQGTQLMRRVAELEYNVRVDEIRREVMETIESLAFNFTIYEVEKNKSLIPPVLTSIPIEALAMQIIDETVRELSNSQAVALFYESKAEIVEHVDVFIERHDWNEAEVVQNTTMTDNAMVIKIKNIMQDLLPRMTYKLWHDDSQTDTLRQVNSALSAWNTGKKKQQATESASMDLDDQPTLSETDMENLMNKKLEEKLKAQEKLIRKNYLADLKRIQKSTASAGTTKGESSSKPSKKSDKNSEKGSKSKSKKDHAEKKVKFQDPPEDQGKGNQRSPRGSKNSKKGRGKGSQGGSPNAGNAGKGKGK
jgi:hypothetical protein